MCKDTHEVYGHRDSLKMDEIQPGDLYSLLISASQNENQLFRQVSEILLSHIFPTMKRDCLVFNTTSSVLCSSQPLMQIFWSKKLDYSAVR